MNNMQDSSDFEVRRRLLQMEMLYEVGVAINESLDPAQVAEEILQRALVMVDARGGALLVRDESGAFAVAGRLGLEGDPQEILNWPGVEEAWSQRKLVQKEGEGTAWRHLCIVPLKSRQEVSGALIVVDRESRDRGVGPFDANDQTLLRSFAYQAGAALHNARLHRSLKEAYAQLQAAQRKLARLEQLRALGELAAEVAHAMRHVLGIVIGRADMYLNFPRDPEKTIRSILETAESGQQIIDRIHQCTRLGVGRKREWVELSALLRTAVEETQSLWKQRAGDEAPPVEWQMELQELPQTCANATDLKEVFDNLILNALEAMPEGGRLSVGTRAEEGKLVVRVRDTGVGMDEEVQRQIFRPFFTTKEEFGTGLGLSIVYRIVDDHGGEVEVQSAPGEGSCFTIRLPVSTEPPPVEEGEDGEAGLDC